VTEQTSGFDDEMEEGSTGVIRLLATIIGGLNQDMETATHTPNGNGWQ
jgi:hypothetical protein